MVEVAYVFAVFIASTRIFICPFICLSDEICSGLMDYSGFGRGFTWHNAVGDQVQPQNNQHPIITTTTTTKHANFSTHNQPNSKQLPPLLTQGHSSIQKSPLNTVSAPGITLHISSADRSFPWAVIPPKSQHELSNGRPPVNVRAEAETSDRTQPTPTGGSCTTTSQS